MMAEKNRGRLRRESPLIAGLWRFLGKLEMTSLPGFSFYLLCRISAWAAARRAIGTRNGEQDT